jgi:hypothetical protein
VPPAPDNVYDAECVGGPFRRATAGEIEFLRVRRWMPRFVIFTPDGGRPMVGIVKDSEVRGNRGDDDDRDDDRRRRGSRRDSTCVVESFVNPRGGTVDLELRIRFV